MAQRYQNGHLRKAKRKSGEVWEFMWREPGDNGKLKQKTLTVGSVLDFRTERDALKQIEYLRLNINRSNLPSALLTFGSLVKHYREVELPHNRTPKTQRVYLAYLNNWILPMWGSKCLHQVKPVAVESWLKTLKLTQGKKQDMANGSKAKIRNIMSVVFSHAVRYELSDRNPITPVRQSDKRSKVPVLLDPAEIHRLFDVLAIRERAMIVCDALTGIRRSELMGLKWADLDFLKRQINIVRSVVEQEVGETKNEASKKPVPMPEHLAQVLSAWRQESTYTQSTDWVWASWKKKGRQPLWLASIMSHDIQPAAKRVGITKQIGWHTFRHTFSTLVKSLGADAKVVQELLRHASIRTTMDVYTQALDEPKRKASDSLADLIMRTGEVHHA
jgi:integrase